MGDVSNERQIDLRLSAQRALLGAIGESVDAVSIGQDGSEIVLRAYVRSPATEEEREDLEVAATEIASDFVSETIRVEVLEDRPQPFELFGFWLFVRRGVTYM